MKERTFIAYFKYLNWWTFSLGVSIDLRAPQVSVHVPFGFFAIGWNLYDPDAPTWEENLIGRG